MTIVSEYEMADTEIKLLYDLNDVAKKSSTFNVNISLCSPYFPALSSS